MFEEGRGVTQSYEEAARWYSKAADQGHFPAQCNLGVMFEGGYGVKQNDAEAAHWYRKAANQGGAYAQSSLGGFFCKAAAWHRAM